MMATNINVNTAQKGHFRIMWPNSLKLHNLIHFFSFFFVDLLFYKPLLQFTYTALQRK